MSKKNTKKHNVAIATPSNTVAAETLAAQLHLPLVAMDSQDYPLLLVVTDERIELRETSKITRPLFVDFLAGKLAHRRKYGGGRGQLIAKAVGIKPGKKLKILDATAGLGRDAFVLACLGCEVDLIERSPVIAALLADGLKRAQVQPEFADIVMDLIVTDATEYLQQSIKQYDVIYLDPMFPERTKSALVKKEMRILKTIVGEDLDASQLLQVARTKAHRVVVKRPKAAEFLANAKPDLQFNGKSSRFDVYLT